MPPAPFRESIQFVRALVPCVFAISTTALPIDRTSQQREVIIHASNFESSNPVRCTTTFGPRIPY